MEVFNLYDGELDEERNEPERFRWRAAILGPKLGATLLGATLYELQPGERSFPYHYEWGCEEWLIVVAGTPTLRTPEGERELARRHGLLRRARTRIWSRTGATAPSAS